MSAQDSAVRTEAKRTAAAASTPPPAAEVADIGEAQRLAARRRERLMSIGSPLGLLLLWEIAAHFAWIDVRFFPAPSTIIGALVELTRSGELVDHVLISMQRVALGFVLGGVPAVIIGISMGIWRPVR